ncbi:hypothetical protein B484DRAFT_412377, partial [Ochromonadaceae sp. CCMP2298]
CKFVQTESVGDATAELRLVQTLQTLVSNKIGTFLADAASWSVLQFAFSTLRKSGGQLSSVLLHQAAEALIRDAMAGLLRQASLPPGIPQCSGVPTLCKMLRYVTNVIKQAAVVFSQPKAPEGKPRPEVNISHLLFCLRAVPVLLLAEGTDVVRLLVA